MPFGRFLQSEYSDTLPSEFFVDMTLLHANRNIADKAMVQFIIFFMVESPSEKYASSVFCGRRQELEPVLQILPQLSKALVLPLYSHRELRHFL